MGPKIADTRPKSDHNKHGYLALINTNNENLIGKTGRKCFSGNSTLSI